MKKNNPGTNKINKKMTTITNPVKPRKKGSSSENQKEMDSNKRMKALVYHGPGKKAWEDKPRPALVKQTDAVVKILKTTICGTDLHIMEGDVPTVTDGRIIGHEGVGIIEEVGTSVSNFKKDDHVIISCITSCGK